MRCLPTVPLKRAIEESIICLADIFEPSTLLVLHVFSPTHGLSQSPEANMPRTDSSKTFYLNI